MSTPAKAPRQFNFQNLDFPLHLYQERAWEALDDAGIREISLQAGIQGGKTSFGSLAVCKQIGVLSQLHPGCNFIVAADTYKTLSQATIPTLLKLINRGLGKYNQGKQEINLITGGKIFCRTSTDPWSVEGIPDCAFAWMDEAGKCSKLFHINVLGRVARLKGKVLYTSTPYAMNWLYKDVEKPALSGERSDIKFIRFSSVDNPAFPQEEFERQKRLLDPRMFRMKYMGVHERMQGLVYQIGAENFVSELKLVHPRYFAAVDWGFSEGHEFAVLVRAIGLDGFRVEVNEFKSASLDPNQQMGICQSLHRTYGVEMFLCDPSRPDMIAALNKAGIPARGFHVGVEAYKTLVAGITEHTALINSGRYKIVRDTLPHLEDEYSTYHWSEFQEEKVPKDVPVKINDHLMDCARMLTVGTMNVHVREAGEPAMTRVRPRLDLFDPRKKAGGSKKWDAY